MKINQLRELVNAEPVYGIWHNWEPLKSKILTKFDILNSEFERLANEKARSSYHSFTKKYQNFLITFDKTVNQRYLDLNLFESDSSTTIIDSDLNTGKSELFYRLIVCNNPDSTALFFNARRSLAKATATRFNIVDYEDAKNGDNITGSMLSLCTNSALKLIGSDFSPQFVVWDECVLNIEHLLSDAVPADLRENLFFHLLSITDNAQHVVFAQSGITTLAELFLTFIDRKPIKILNSYQPWKGTPCNFFKSKSALTEQMINVARGDTPFLCACNSSQQANSLFLLFNKLFQAKKFLLINSRTASGAEQTQFFENPNKSSLCYDGVFFSPSVESGLSIDNNHFVEAFGFCSSSINVNPPESFVQMLMRGRDIKKLSVWVDSRYLGLPTTREKCVAGVLAKLEVTPTKTLVDGVARYSFDSSPLIELAIEKTVIENTSRNNAQWTVRLLLERKGFDVAYIDSSSSVGTKMLNDSKKIMLRDYQENILAAKKINHSDFLQLQRKQNLSESEYWILDRYQLERKTNLNVSELSEVEANDFFKFWNYGHALDKILAIEEGFLTPDAAIAIGQKKSLMDARSFYCRWFIRSGLLKSLRISNNNFCDKGPINFQQFFNTAWFNFAVKNLDLVNSSNLGHTRMIVGAIDIYSIRCWVRAMGIVINKQHKINLKSMFWLIKIINSRKQK